MKERGGIENHLQQTVSSKDCCRTGYTKFNLVCEQKCVAIHHAHSTNVPFTKELVDTLTHHQYQSIGNDLTVDILTQFKDKVLRDKFRAFLQASAD